MFRRVLAILLVCILIPAGSIALCESDDGLIQSTFVASADLTIDQWCESGISRAMFSWCALLDFQLAGYDATLIDVQTRDSYVATMDNTIALIASLTDDHLIIIFYDPESKSMSFIVTDSVAADAETMESVLDSMTTAHYKNDPDELSVVRTRLLTDLQEKGMTEGMIPVMLADLSGSDS